MLQTDTYKTCFYLFILHVLLFSYLIQWVMHEVGQLNVGLVIQLHHSEPASYCRVL